MARFVAVAAVQSCIIVQGNIPKDRADKPLQAWQISKLQAAAAAGRRKVKVGQCCLWLAGFVVQYLVLHLAFQSLLLTFA